MVKLLRILAVGFALAFCARPAFGAIPGIRPNIIFILADDLGWGDIGVHGQKRIHTPNIDRLAAEGMRFPQFYAGATVCAPSRSVLMTGLHTGHTTVRGNAPRTNSIPQTLRADDVTVAKVLKSAGYATGLIGKWGLGLPGDSGHPNRQGFDYFYGFLSQFHAHNHFPAHLWRNEERVALSNQCEFVGPDGAGWATNRVQYAGDLFADEALAFVKRNQERPFFLYFASVAPHANNERANRLGDGQEVPDYGRYETNRWPNPDKGQAAMVTRLDRDVGRLLALLRDLNLDERTVVIFSSDNGPHREGGNDPDFFDANGPFRGLKRDHSDGGIRVPFIVRWPGKIAPGRVSTHVGWFADFLPTAAELAGSSIVMTGDGLSLVPTLLGNDAKQARHPYLYWEFHERGFSQAVLIDGRWKGIRDARQTAPIELYDLARDPAELFDVAAQNLPVTAQVERLFRTARTDSELWPIRNARPPNPRPERRTSNPRNTP